MVYNPDQIDENGDGKGKFFFVNEGRIWEITTMSFLGDACDEDYDGDEIVDYRVNFKLVKITVNGLLKLFF